jgi:hypothetical protein
MGFDPNKLEQAKRSFDPEKLKQAKAVGSEAGSPEAGDFDFAGSARRTAGKIWEGGLKQQILPTLTSFAATRLPAMTVSGPAGLLIAPAVEGLYQFGAGFAGEKLNQLMGVTEPSDLEAVGQGIGQGLVASGGKTYGMLRPFVGRDGAVKANDLAAKEGRQLIAKYKPTTESAVAFDEAFKEGAEIPMNQTMGVMRDTMAPIGGRRTPSYAYGSAAKDILVIQSELASGRPMSAKQWQFLHTRLGQTIGQMEETGQKKGLDRAKQLYAAMYDDLERAAENEVRPRNTGIVEGVVTPLGKRPVVEPKQSAMPMPGETVPKLTGDTLPAVPEKGQVPSTELKAPEGARIPDSAYDIEVPGTGAGKLKKALTIYLREKSIEDIGEYMKKAMNPLRGQGGDQQFNAAQVIRNLRDDRFFEKAFTVAERKDIIDTLNTINRAPALPTPSSVNAGSKRMNQRIAGAVAGAGAGAYAGGPMGAAAGAVAGFTARDAADFATNMSFAMSTKVGRAMVKELAKTKGGLFTPRNASVLAAYTSALRHQPNTEMTE